MHHRTWLLATALIASLVFAAPAFADTAFVTTNNDSGEGSFRAAVEAANADSSITEIAFVAKNVTITSDTVVYEGAQTLTITGNGARVRVVGNGSFDLFDSNGGADLAIYDLTLADSNERGLVVTIPGDASGVVSLLLDNVVVSGHKKFGVHVSDADASDAGVYVEIIDSRIRNNGIDAIIGTEFDDQDGLRVDELGAGDIECVFEDSEFVDNKYDGCELDESGAGAVVAIATGCDFSRNGDGSLPDPNADDPEEIDPEDGFDVDAAGGGDVEVTLIDCSVDNNDDEGIDLDQAGDGDCTLVCDGVSVKGNVDEGVKISQGEDEQGTGDILLVIEDSIILGNGGDGIKLEDFDAGDITAYVTGCSVKQNDDGIELEQINEDDFEATGSITLELVDSQVKSNGDEGVAVAVFGTGELATVTVDGSQVKNNGGTGLKIEQEFTPNGTLEVTDSQVKHNDEDIELENVTEL